MSKYQRKTRDIYVVQQHTGRQYGWEDVDSGYDRNAMRQSVRDYESNQPEYPVRLIMRREPIA